MSPVTSPGAVAMVASGRGACGQKGGGGSLIWHRAAGNHRGLGVAMDIQSYLAAKERCFSSDGDTSWKAAYADSGRGVRSKERDRSGSRRQALHGGSTMVEAKSHK